MVRLKKLEIRRLGAVFLSLGALVFWLIVNPENYAPAPAEADSVSVSAEQNNREGPTSPSAMEILGRLEIKGKAPSTGYKREEFYASWGEIQGCDMRNVVLKRDLSDTVLEGCIVKSGNLHDPYTGEVISFVRGENSSAVQIDHVVALADAWKKGAQNISKDMRYALANDPLNLLAVDGPANSQKGSSDAASWLPKNKSFRCQYVARQISVKYKYTLWVTTAEKDMMAKVLEKCPQEPAIGVEF